ncbi:MAG: hypothetical protein ACP5O3_04590, partial [Candidatus Micrarchaeia archaeon]
GRASENRQSVRHSSFACASVWDGFIIRKYSAFSRILLYAIISRFLSFDSCTYFSFLGVVERKERKGGALGRFHHPQVFCAHTH